MALHFHKLAIKDVRRETADCISVAFEIPDDLKDAFKFHPGQNITIRQRLNNDELRRSYSICSGVHENELRVAIRQIPGGRFSSWANASLAKGRVLEVLAPTGSFTTNTSPDHKKQYLAIAAGSGITPVISIIRSVLHYEPQSRFTLVYGNRNRASIIFREQLDALKNRNMERLAIHHLLTREIPEADIYSGRINAAKCAEFAKKLIDFASMDEIFLCGPAEMVFEIKDWLLGHGIKKEKIHFELFSVPAAKVDSPTANGVDAAASADNQTLETATSLRGQGSSEDQPSDQQQLSDQQPFTKQHQSVHTDQSGDTNQSVDTNNSEDINQSMDTNQSVVTNKSEDINQSMDTNQSEDTNQFYNQNQSANVSQSQDQNRLPHQYKSSVSHITIKQDGLSLDFDLAFDSDSILEAALDHGADLPFSCKGGVCSTCRARLIEGEVKMELNYALEPEEVAAGFVLVCQSRPLTDRVVINFDE